MKLSIIVPAYNEEQSIADTLKGLKAQTYKDIELIVVDNNSKDRTGDIARQYTDRVYTETTQGYIFAVIRGSKESTGELITFCDADTVYPPDWAARIVKHFLDNEIVAVYGPCGTFDTSKWGSIFNQIAYTLFLLISKLFGLDNTAGFNFVMRKAVFDDVGGYDPAYKKMSPDIELGKRLKKKGKIVLDPTIVVASSARRFKEGGTFQTTWMFAKAWWSMVIGKTPNVDYNTYNAGVKK